MEHISGSKGPKSAVLLCTEQAFDFLALQILYCLKAAGVRTHLLTDGRSKVYRLSRYCVRYVETSFLRDNVDVSDFIEYLNTYIRTHLIDIVIPSDIDTVRLLVRSRPHIEESGCFPVSDLQTIETLNNKWEFAQLLRRLDVPTPKTIMISDPRDITAACLEPLGFPLMIKPLQLSGGRGVVKLTSFRDVKSHLESSGPCNRLPLLAQRFVPGIDAGLSMLAEKGALRAWTLQKRRTRRLYDFFVDRSLLELGKRIIDATQYTGVMHLDIRLDANSDAPMFLECNPRLWLSVPASMWQGINFVDYGVRLALGQMLPEQTTCKPGIYYDYRYVLPNLVKIGNWAHVPKASYRAALQTIADPFPVLIRTRTGKRLTRFFKVGQ